MREARNEQQSGINVDGDTNIVKDNKFFINVNKSRVKDGQVPYLYPEVENKTFVGRKGELEELERLLESHGTVAIAAAAGMGGVGKTELVRQYVKQRKKKYSGGIWWLERGDRVGQILVNNSLCRWPAPPDNLVKDRDKVRWVYEQWLERFPHGERLLVWDDEEDFRHVKELLPQDGRFRVLLTTRKRWGPPVQRLDLDVLPPSAAFRLLRRLVNDDNRIKEEVAAARALCKWLGYLPLGLELVGRYLAPRPHLTLAKTLERLKQKRLKAKAVGGEVREEMGYRNNVAAAFELSWATLKPSTHILAGALSLFALAPIPLHLIQAALPDWDEEDLEEELDEKLVHLSLLSTESQTGTYSFHTLVREFVREKLATELEEQRDKLRQSVAQGLIGVANRVPETVTVEVVEGVQEALPHLVEAATHLTDWIENDIDRIPLFIALGRIAQYQSRWEDAENWFQEYVTFAQQRFGENHPYTAGSLNNLAGLYQAMGRYTEAEPLLKRALAITEEELGANHPYTATCLNNLAELLYESIRKYTEAEPLYNRALAIYEKELGANHPNTANSLNNLAGLYNSMGKYTEAEPLLKRALAIREKELGANHPDTATSLNNLALLYYSMGKYTEAEPLYNRVLAIRKKELGANHPFTATSLNNLALLYYSMGKYTEAEP
ncbi:MAG: tetratricopeptide repeat protein, partial [Prochloron sp. SP5CPC1]|nr:tetratricopeptide repeat protein [Candidatus Paraprochloron terpiosi SP5CPC1]